MLIWILNRPASVIEQSDCKKSLLKFKMFVMSCLFNLMLLYFCKIDVNSLSELNKSGIEGSDCCQLLLSILIGCWILIVSLDWLFLFQCDEDDVLNIYVISEFTENNIVSILKDCWVNNVGFLLWIAISASLILTVLSKFPLFILLCVIRSMTLLNSVISLCEFHESVSKCQMAFEATEGDENR